MSSYELRDLRLTVPQKDFFLGSPSETQNFPSRQDPAEHVELWMQLLSTLSHFTPNLAALLAHRSAPVVLGVMAASRLSAHAQQYGASVLSQLALHQPGPGEKVHTRCSL